MIAKIGHGANMTGALSYNQLKVDKENGQVLDTQKIIETPVGSYTVAQLYRSFEPYLIANKRTEKPVLHISLNPDPGDKVTDENFRQIAKTIWSAWATANSRISSLSIPILSAPIFILYLPTLTVTV